MPVNDITSPPVRHRGHYQQWSMPGLRIGRAFAVGYLDAEMRMA
jgi:hypothetical protein